MKYVLLFFCAFPSICSARYFHHQTCYSYTQCEAILPGFECSNGICQCSENKILSSDGTRCLREVNGYGAKCEDNVQCSESLRSGGVCVNNICKCTEGFHYKNERCYKNIDLNEECVESDNCYSAYEYVGLECKNKKCICREEYYQRLNSGCRRKKKIGESCNLDSDCPKGIKCNNMVCSNENATVEFPNTFHPLQYDFYENEQTDHELGDYELGEQCYNHCGGIKNAICLENVCVCKHAVYVASEDNKRCLPTTRGKVKDIRNSTCEENAQCAVFGGNSICKNGKCACKGGTYWEVRNQFCWIFKLLGDKCEVTEDCNPARTHAKCENEI